MSLGAAIGVRYSNFILKIVKRVENAFRRNQAQCVARYCEMFVTFRRRVCSYNCAQGLYEVLVEFKFIALPIGLAFSAFRQIETNGRNDDCSSGGNDGNDYRSIHS